MRAFHSIDDAPHRIRRLNRERLGIAPRRHERQHHHVGVAVEKYVFDEFFGSEAVEITARAWFGSEPASRFGRPLERIGGRALYPCTSRIHEVPLHIEDEFTFATDSRLRELRLERGFRFEFEKTIALPRRRIGCIEREQCARSAARGNEKITAVKI